MGSYLEKNNLKIIATCDSNPFRHMHFISRNSSCCGRVVVETVVCAGESLRTVCTATHLVPVVSRALLGSTDEFGSNKIVSIQCITTGLRIAIEN